MPGNLSIPFANTLINASSTTITTAPATTATNGLPCNNNPTTNTNVEPAGPYTPVTIAVVNTRGINPIARANATIAASAHDPSETSPKEIGSPATIPKEVAIATKPPMIANNHQLERILLTLSPNVVTNELFASPVPLTLVANASKHNIPASIAIPNPFNATFASPRANLPNLTVNK